MKEIFTELYKKVLGFFQAQEKENLKEVACNRLKLVLMQDRTNLTPFLLEKMRGEMIDVLSKYVEMDKEALELNFEQEGEQMALMLSIPVLRAKDEEEISALLDEEERVKREEEIEISESEKNVEESEEEIEETEEEETEDKIEEVEEVEETEEEYEATEDLDIEEKAKIVSKNKKK